MKDHTEPPAVVLDTNAVFDWLVFDDPAARGFGEAILNRQVRWVGTRAMAEEIAHVLARGVLGHRGAGTLDLHMQIQAWMHIEPEPTATTPPPHPRCSDPDDQKFIDLALHLRAAWLLTRDKALLRLARHAREAGVAVIEPARWQIAAPQR